MIAGSLTPPRKNLGRHYPTNSPVPKTERPSGYSESVVLIDVGVGGYVASGSTYDLERQIAGMLVLRRG